VARAEQAKPVERADTIALVDQMDKPRDVSNKVAIALVVGLSLLAGIGAYVVRATSGPADAASSGPTASVGQPLPPVGQPVLPDPPRSPRPKR
jgi:serine/threonine-protein kinase